MSVRKVIFTDRGLGKIMAQVKRAGALRVRAGVVGAVAQEPHGDSGLTVGEVATINEFGSDDGHVPKRSFIGGTFKNNASDVKDWARMAATVIVNGTSAESALSSVGEHMVKAIKKNIEEITTMPNAPSTVAKKGFDHPLIDTGLMAGAITYELERGTGEILDAGAAVGDYESFEVGGEG